MGAATAVVDGATVPLFANVVDPRPAPPKAGLVSRDRTSVRIGASCRGRERPSMNGWRRCGRSWTTSGRPTPTCSIHSLDSSLANEDIQELVNGGLDASLRLTIPLTFIILLIAFGAVVAAVVPLVLAITALLAAFGVLGLYSQYVAPVSPYASQLVVLIGLAVAVDYSLFMITRYRTERRHGRAKSDAILRRVGDGRASRVLLGPRGDVLDRRPVPAR